LALDSSHLIFKETQAMCETDKVLNSQQVWFCIQSN